MNLPHEALLAPTPPPQAASTELLAAVTMIGDLLMLGDELAPALLRFLESAAAVRRRYQFFVWTQNQMQPLVPHQLMVCGAFLRQRRAVVYDAFHNIVLPPALLHELTDADGPLLAALIEHWVSGRGQPQALDLAQLGGAAGAAAQALSAGLGGSHLLLHGVARPQRPTEIESFFIFGGAGNSARLAQRAACLNLVLPYLHSTWQRVVVTEHEFRRPAPLPAPAAAPRAAAALPRGTVTERERQILRWVREGKSNLEIGLVLGISPLTVKNHVQKILRKLGAGNRAQAVAQALARNLIDPADRTEPASIPRKPGPP